MRQINKRSAGKSQHVTGWTWNWESGGCETGALKKLRKKKGGFLPG